MIDTSSRALARLLPLAVLAALLMLAGVPAAGGKSRPKCFGKPATQVGSTKGNRIVAKPHAVVWAGKGNDKITVAHADHTTHVICGGGGNDVIKGGSQKDILIGGAGDDRLNGGRGSDLLIGDNATRRGDATCPCGNDYLGGASGRDFIVGDNYSVKGDAIGGHHDRRLHGAAGKDTLIGDSASLKGDASGGAPDHLEGAQGADRVIGDSFALRGTARGGGKDEVNGGPGRDLQVGDNYTNTGMAIGGGRDEIHAADGGDAGAKCRRNDCDDRFYGDNYAAACATEKVRSGLIVMIVCAKVQGGAKDLLTSDQGNDFLNGGPPNVPGARTDGDWCIGGAGRDVATMCEYRRGISKLIAFR